MADIRAAFARKLQPERMVTVVVGGAAMKSRRPQAKTPAAEANPPRQARATRRRPQAVPPGEVRIIGGQWKRSKLPVADKPGLRPTPDRVRETLFNWLGQDLSGWRCVDAFAGTGALGFEAASRGAAQVLLVEQDSALVAQLKQDARSSSRPTAVQVQRGDGIAALSHGPPASADLIFLDPPFDAEPVRAGAAGGGACRGTGWLTSTWRRRAPGVKSNSRRWG